MSKRNNPATSNDAYKSLRASEIREMYKKIAGALERLGMASTEQIAAYMTTEHAKVHKRVSEMEGLGMIYRPGHRVPTKSGRTAFVWCLCSAGAKTDNENKPLHGKTISDYSKELIPQPQLF